MRRNVNVPGKGRYRRKTPLLDFSSIELFCLSSRFEKREVYTEYQTISDPEPVRVKVSEGPGVHIFEIHIDEVSWFLTQGRKTAYTYKGKLLNIEYYVQQQDGIVTITGKEVPPL